MKRLPTTRVDLERCLSSADILDWILQVDGRSGDDQVTVGLVRALEDLLSP